MAACLPVLNHGGITDLFKFVPRAYPEKSVILMGDTHAFTDDNNEIIQKYDDDQLNVMQKMLLKRDKNGAKSVVNIEQPFDIDDTHRYFARRRSCLNSLYKQSSNTAFTATEFNNVEERKYSGLAFILFSLPLQIIKPTMNVVINGTRMIAAIPTIKDVKDEYKSMLNHSKKTKKIFDTQALKKLRKQRISKTKDSYADFKQINKDLAINDDDSLLTVARKVDCIKPHDLSLPSDYDMQDATTLRPAFSQMITDMVDPLFELSLFKRIRTSAENTITITGATHARWLKLMVEQSEQFTPTYSTANTKLLNRSVNEMVQPNEIVKLF